MTVERGEKGGLLCEGEVKGRPVQTAERKEWWGGKVGDGASERVVEERMRSSRGRGWRRGGGADGKVK